MLARKQERSLNKQIQGFETSKIEDCADASVRRYKQLAQRLSGSNVIFSTYPNLLRMIYPQEPPSDNHPGDNYHLSPSLWKRSRSGARGSTWKGAVKYIILRTVHKSDTALCSFH